jgi:alpha-L-fucosidase 2
VNQRMKLLHILLAALVPAASTSLRAVDLSRYNVVWNTPSKDASGVMPIGNGDLAADVYAIENGDLFLLLAKNDAYNYQGDIFKTGRVRVSLTPNPFMTDKAFRQTLDLNTGSIRIEADGIVLCVWADAKRPLFHVEITSPREVAVVAQPEFWKRFDHCTANLSDFTGSKSSATSPPAEPPQDVRLERRGKLLWYLPVGDRSVFPDDLKYYQVEAMAAKFSDPFRFNTFGNLLESPNLKLQDGALRGAGKTFDIRIHALTLQTPNPAIWIEAIEKQAAQPVDTRRDWGEHCRWWSKFWDRGWIITSDNSQTMEARERFNGESSPGGSRKEADGAALVAQSYNVFRYLMACQSRGRVQVKFNGGLFTQQLRVKSEPDNNRPGAVALPDGMLLTHEDDRLWGRRFTYQNQRLLYWPLLASGDFDLMKPFFDYYWHLLPMRQAITKAWFGHDGAYFRENLEPTGAERDCGQDGRPPKQPPATSAGYYHDYYFTSGLETLALMLDYVNFTRDATFRDEVLVPFARQVLLFFDQHYARSADGKLRIDPGQVLETWWLAVNPAPDVAGLRFCLDELLAVKAGSAFDQARWRRFRTEIPEVLLQTVDGRQTIAPAEKWSNQHNAENGELYPVFPFRCFGVALGSGELVSWTMKHRSVKDAFGCACWTQDQIHWACAGNAAEAADGLVRRFRVASPMCRFPMYGREGPDSCPDFDHFGAGSVALQRMIVQEAGGRIFLLPAWPADWDLDFKLHVSGSAVLAGSVKDGKLRRWDITPARRKQDVIVGQPQPRLQTPVIP